MAQPGEKIVTLDDIFVEREAEMRRFNESPEGKALDARLAERSASAQAARERWEAANPRTPYQEGADACLRHEEREAPDGLSAADQAQWLEGYDSEAPDDADDE